ncbi:uncharacterized protein LOC119282182 [Triticum dicoccoides]|uniref:uncharacterized protein LOC119282182 n=1 Tax=Triticum dicoccoides TaxID=85692 RepID=UPI00188F9DAA|nr:uncharacterized protein LOC119282182 [Triticum dicoccoides]
MRTRSSSTSSPPAMCTRSRSSSISSPPPAAKPARSSSTSSTPEVKRRRGRSPPSRFPPCPAAIRGDSGLMLILFETPSGFAIFTFCGLLISRRNAVQEVWLSFTDGRKAKRAVFLEEFRTFKDKSKAINKSTGVSKRLTEMIMNCRFPEQKIAVGKLEYKRIIEERLNIDCLYNTAVMEVMWGIQHCMPSLLPQEKSQLTEADCLPMSLGLHYVLQHYDCDVNTDMVDEQIVATASALFQCDSVEKKYSGALRRAGDLIKDVSGINCKGWTLLKIATALKMIWWPEFGDSCEVSEDDVSRLVAHAYIYNVHKNKDSCLRVYKDMVEAHEIKTSKKELLKSLVELANKTYEAQGPEKNV